MKYFILIILVIFASGCAKYVTSDDILKAEEVCLQNDGIKTILRDTFGSFVIDCENGARFFGGK